MGQKLGHFPLRLFAIFNDDTLSIFEILLSRTCLVDECFCNLFILLFSQLVHCLLEINSILFLSVVDLSGNFPRVSNHLWVKGWVKPSLSLGLITEIVMLPKIYFFKKFHLHTSLEKYKRCSRKIFLFFTLQ